MEPEVDKIRPIKIFGIVLITFAIVGTFFFGSIFLKPSSPEFIFGPTPPSKCAMFFVIGSSIFYFLAGLGILLRAKWGYIMFKIFLYIFFISFPIGTIISYLTLSYMRKYQIKKYFGFTIFPA